MLIGELIKDVSRSLWSQEFTNNSPQILFNEKLSEAEIMNKNVVRKRL